MSAISSWIKNGLFSRPSKPKIGDSPDLQNRPPTSVDKFAISCLCHPDEEPDRFNVLCKACRRFVDDCYWIQMRKLSASQFSKLSKRQLKRGSYTMDGDASGGIMWDYEFSLKDRSKGCHFCELIATVWTPSVTGPGYANFSRCARIQLSVYYSPSIRKWAQLQISVSNVDEEYIQGSLKLCHESKSTPPLRPDDPGSPTDADASSVTDSIFADMGRCTGSNANFNVAKHWLESCRQSHARCNRAKPAVTVYPSRLIHVGTESEEPHLHEVVPDELIPEYMTLSHCWGGHSLTTLKLATLTDFKSRISLSTVSKTFQEAMSIVRNLGYQYIWIDSLCIIQDSPEDWERESEIMGDIYRNSICTIAATASKTGDEGCFRLRNTLRNRPCQIWGNELHRIFVDIEDNVATERYRHEVNSGPLNQRAWVLQERVLSSRILHYSATSVYWDCHEAHLSDSGRQISEDRSLSWGFGEGDIRLFDGIDIRDGDFSDQWQSSIEKYCRMKLTFETDRFIAFKGIIKYIQEETGSECKFGLWETYLPAHLLWRIANAASSDSITRTTESSIPSWSWASIAGGRLRYFPPNIDNMAITFWYPDSFGGWPNKTRDIATTRTSDVVADIFKQMELGVDPENGYSSEKVYCSTYISSSSSFDLASISISAKLNSSPTSGTAMLASDDFTDEEKDQIINALQIKPGRVDGSTAHRLLICVWPDISSQFSSLSFNSKDDLSYLRISVQGAYKPKIKGFLSSSPTTYPPNSTDSAILAPYALHTSGLVLSPVSAIQPAEKPFTYRRIGFFRAIETFATYPPPHPKGFNPNEAPWHKWYLNRAGWFSDASATKIVEIV